MKSIVSMLLALVVTVSFAQRPAADVIQTSKGPLSIQPVKHATLVFTWGGKTIYADPDGGKKAFEGLADPDLILITDIHGDHFNIETLNAINTDHATLIVPQAVADKLPDNLKSKAVVLDNGKTVDKLNVSIKAIPMYNLPEAPDAKHTKGRGNGYVLMFGNKTVYLSGDTAGIPEMRALKNIDVAFVCMNLPYTMDVPEAASAVLDFKPKIVYPYHYRGQNGLSDTEAFKKMVNEKDKNIEVRVRNWYPG
jgi:L-ascorbate metabolism protein UlaG (beta-lactamase superfamily)